MVISAREALEERRALSSSPDDDKTRAITSGATSEKTTTFVRSSAENLRFLENGSVDLVIAAQACHWFDWSKVWPELGRVLRKGGSVAFWTYSEFRLPAYPHLTPLIEHYAQYTQDPSTSVGGYWQQPGRNILVNHLVEVPEPNKEIFEPLERVYFTGPYFPSLPAAHTRPIIMRKKMTWIDLLEYLRTWSALHTLKEHHPEDSLHPEGPLEVRFWNSLRRGAVQGSIGSRAEVGGANGGEVGDRGAQFVHQHDAIDKTVADPESEVDLEWGVTLILTRKVSGG